MTSAKPDHSSLMARLERLERQYRRMRVCVMCVVLAAASVVVLGAKTVSDGKTLEVSQIIIKDKDGNTRIVLGPDRNPNTSKSRTGVFVYDADGKNCVGLSATETHGQLFVEENGKYRLSLGTGKQEFAGLLIYAEAGKGKAGQIILFYTDDGKPFLGFNDTNGKTRISMMLDTNRSEKSVLALQDENQQSFFSRTQP